ncbi:Lateral signaling target protein 2 [Chamberlinius hualienensis]
MFSILKWLYKPKKEDSSILAQFFYADEELNLVATELDSFDGRKDPERCTALVNQLRQSQDKVLNICNLIMDEVIPDERANRDFRVKFPDDVLQENLAGQLWFGAECLAAGSSILNRELESKEMRPLAKNLTKTLDNVRALLREQCLRNPRCYSEKLKESLRVFDSLFAEFELSYVSAMVPVKTVKEYDMQQDLVVLFSETLQHALSLQLLTQESVDDYDPALMFTIPRIAIVCGLLIFPDGPLQVDGDPEDLSEMFKPFHNLLVKIRDLLWTLSQSELLALERCLCSVDDSTLNWDEINRENMHGNFPLADFDDYFHKFYQDYPICKEFITDIVPCALNKEDATYPPTNSNDTDYAESQSHKAESVLDIRRDEQSSSSVASGSVYCTHARDHTLWLMGGDDESDEDDESTSDLKERMKTSRRKSHDCEYCSPQYKKSVAASPKGSVQGSPSHGPTPAKRAKEVPLSRRVLIPDKTYLSSSKTCAGSPQSNWDTNSFYSTDTSSYNSECQDDEEIALALQAAEIANRDGIRSRFKDSHDLIHRLFVCISGVADQLQTNSAADLRNILKFVFEMNCSHPLTEITHSSPRHSFPEMAEERVSIESAEEANERDTQNTCEGSEAPEWIPDELAPHCMSCMSIFNLVRRRHHCRNCGKVFCGRCSSNSVALPRYGLNKPVRVCNRCFMFQVTPFVIPTEQQPQDSQPLVAQE